MTKLAHDQRQVHILKVLHIGGDGVLVGVDLVHVYGEKHIGEGVCGENFRRIGAHEIFPVLPPAGGIHHNGMGQARIAQSLYRGRGAFHIVER